MGPETPTLEFLASHLPTQPELAGRRREMHEWMGHTEPIENSKHQETFLCLSTPRTKLTHL